ncbi:MAG: glycoside hydrolase family 2 [Clostridia bacterium]|nr:glycoside hydrolase family 2 [Clostridia bacterium]
MKKPNGWLDFYPRPQLKRDSFFSLNGEWEFNIGEAGRIPAEFQSTINVPFVPQSELSDCSVEVKIEDTLFYKKSFTLPRGFVKDRVILNFGAVNNCCNVFLNGQKVGENIGGYNRFSFDVTNFLQENNTLIVEATNKLDGILPYGKQRKKRGGMWYTPVSGIWQSVWLESVPSVYIKYIDITTKGNEVTFLIDGVNDGLVYIMPNEEPIARFVDGRAIVKISDPKYWTPETPHIYNVKIVCEKDEVQTYFALRELEIKNIDGYPRLLLNGKPYFFNGLLDQGYFADGIFTPSTPEEYKNDILFAKRSGFNMLRKHIKIEPDVFYYYCDTLGMAVFQDMVNNSDYSFIRDTALPTIALKRLNDTFLHKNKKSRQAFIEGMLSTVGDLKNFPSVCEWTIFNEGWGQFCSSKMYGLLKVYDSTRFIDSASGWFKAKDTDFESEHVYFKDIKLKAKKRPLFLSEFGGYSLMVDTPYSPQKEYGYRSFKDKESYTEAVVNLYKTQVLPLIEKGLCAAVYTQLTDVEDEINGLITYDRTVEKIDSKILSNLFKGIN